MADFLHLSHAVTSLLLQNNTMPRVIPQPSTTIFPHHKTASHSSSPCNGHHGDPPTPITRKRNVPQSPGKTHSMPPTGLTTPTRETSSQLSSSHPQSYSQSISTAPTCAASQTQHIYGRASFVKGVCSEP